MVFYPRQEGTDSAGRPFSEDFIRAFEMQFSDGLSYVAGQPAYAELRTVQVNPNSIVDLTFPTQFIRFLRLRVGAAGTSVHPPFELAEFQVYGDGFVPRSVYESEVVDLGPISNYGAISWSIKALVRDGDQVNEVDLSESLTRATVRMKTGLDDTPLLYFRDVIDPDTRAVSQELVSESEYAVLPSSEQGDIEEDAEFWSSWSLPLESGQQVPLPSPRPFFKLQIVLESESVLQAIRIDSLSSNTRCRRPISSKGKSRF